MASKVDTFSLIQFAPTASVNKNSSLLDIDKAKGRDFKADFNEARSRSHDDKRDVKVKDKSLEKKVLNHNKVHYKLHKQDPVKSDQDEKAGDDQDKIKGTQDKESMQALLDILNNLTATQQTDEQITKALEDGGFVLTPDLLNQIKAVLQELKEAKASISVASDDLLPKFKGEVEGLFNKGLFNKAELQNVPKTMMPLEDVKALLEKLVNENKKVTGDAQTGTETQNTAEGPKINEQTIIKDTLVKPLRAEGKYDKVKTPAIQAEQAQEGEGTAEKTESKIFTELSGQEKAKAAAPEEKTFKAAFKLNTEQNENSLYDKNIEGQNNKASETPGIRAAMKAERTAAAPKFEVINQIVKNASVLIREGHSEMNMQLEPAKLGKLSLKLVVEQGLVTAKFITESQQVKEIIESNFNELKDMLQEKGINVQNFSVSVGQDSQNQSAKQSFTTWREYSENNSRRSTIAAGDTLEAVEGYDRPAVNPYEFHDGTIDYRA